MYACIYIYESMVLKFVENSKVSVYHTSLPDEENIYTPRLTVNSGYLI